MVAQDSFCSLNSSNGILFDFFIACFSLESVMCISVKQGKPMFIHSFIHSFLRLRILLSQFLSHNINPYLLNNPQTPYRANHFSNIYEPHREDLYVKLLDKEQ